MVAHGDGLAHQLASINEDELESSYWHPGPISSLMVSEFDAASAGLEIILGGSNLHIPINDGLSVERVPVLAALPSSDFSGQATPGLGAGELGAELFYTVLDQSPVNTLPISCIELDESGLTSRVLGYVREDCQGSSYCIEQSSGALCDDSE